MMYPSHSPPSSDGFSTNYQSRIAGRESLLQRFQHLALDLPILLDAPGHAHRARLKHQAPIAIVSVGEEHHFIHAALVLQRDEHHVAVIFSANMPVSHYPAAQPHALSVQAWQFIAP